MEYVFYAIIHIVISINLRKKYVKNVTIMRIMILMILMIRIIQLITLFLKQEIKSEMVMINQYTYLQQTYFVMMYHQIKE